MTSFNLVDEPWIPCQFPGAATTQSLGLQEVLVRAHEIREIAGHTPLATMALHRLLLAITHRIFGPSGRKAWQALRSHGQFDTDAIQAYFRQWRHRFDLFDAERPFYQDAGIAPECRKPVAQLFHERTSGNNALLFDHSWDSSDTAIPSAIAAQQLLVQQALALGGMVSTEPGAPKENKFATAAPLVKCAVFTICGDTLFETLLLNLVPYDPTQELPFDAEGPDQPAWERPQAASVSSRMPGGFLDLLTWQSRRIRLYAKPGDPSVVTGVGVFKGESLPEGYSVFGKEQAVAFRSNPNAKQGDAWIPIGFQEGRTLWRDSIALLPTAQAERARPLVLQRLAEYGATLPHLLNVQAIGLVSDQAKSEFWRQEMMAWPRVYLDAPPSLAQALRDAVDLAEKTGELLRGGKVENRPTALRVLIEAVQGNVPDFHAAAESLGAERAYWGRLESAFARVMNALPDDQTEVAPGVIRFGDRILPAWTATLRHIAQSAFAEATAGFQGHSRNLKALALAERTLNRQLFHILGPSVAQQQEKEETHAVTR
jgi:CRISPR system Cascade subunit CasA